MPQVIGIDPGTVSIDICGLADGQVVLDRTFPTADAVADPSRLIEALSAHGTPDLVAGLSGYGLPLRRAAETSDHDLHLAFLARRGEQGGIGGLRRLVRALADLGLPLMLLPGVIHLDTVPAHRKINRIDLGTADKLCAAALGVHDQATRLGLSVQQTSFILLELGGAFTAALAVQGGQVVDGIGGSSGAIGWQAAGGLDGEVAYLAGVVEKAMLFQGGVTTVAASDRHAAGAGFDAFIEGAVKMVRQRRSPRRWRRRSWSRGASPRTRQSASVSPAPCPTFPCITSPGLRRTASRGRRAPRSLLMAWRAEPTRKRWHRCGSGRRRDRRWITSTSLPPTLPGMGWGSRDHASRTPARGGNLRALTGAVRGGGGISGAGNRWLRGS